MFETNHLENEMLHVLQEEPSSPNSNVKSKRNEKKSTTKMKVEFRWSVFAAQNKPIDQTPALNLHSMGLNQSKKIFSSSKSPAVRSLTSNKTSLSKQTPAVPYPRSSNINSNMNKIEQPSVSTDNTQACPLLLSYAQLRRAQQLSKLHEISETPSSSQKTLSTKSNSSSRSQQKLANHKHIQRYITRLKNLRSSDKR
ncbi:unnamed protein product [Rotaria magnacalcarata]|uniref:Uncharacterized protein n=4 Tax=Rotaria magnacalcarata TaxID=392030 RepID=A0A819H6H3_9BILA|nr:unnamed protein product [Rotaria magnacalcarata]CAF3893052.1 unnamed protein product [Rotaria magnacalcarata]CAF5145496.1 unnamed protein product [Rotaria magnacalcarata]